MSYNPDDFAKKVEVGTVIYFKLKESDSHPHYFIVLNKNPLTDEKLYMVIASSRVDAVRNRHLGERGSANTLVIIKKEEYAEFTMPESIVDCNFVYDQFTLKELALKEFMGKLEVKPKMDINIVKKLRAAVCDSYIVPRVIQGKVSN